MLLGVRPPVTRAAFRGRDPGSLARVSPTPICGLSDRAGLHLRQELAVDLLATL